LLILKLSEPFLYINQSFVVILDRVEAGFGWVSFKHLYKSKLESFRPGSVWLVTVMAWKEHNSHRIGRQRWLDKEVLKSAYKEASFDKAASGLPLVPLLPLCWAEGPEIL
jgi:hypothetical protein